MATHPLNAPSDGADPASAAGAEPGPDPAEGACAPGGVAAESLRLGGHHQLPRESERRALEHGSSGSTADFAVEGRPRLEDRYIDAPYARAAPRLPDGEIPDQLAEKKAVTGDPREALIDEAVEETFPASDPPSFNPRIT